MKKYSILALALVLAATMLAGCRNPNAGDATTPSATATMPTILPTNVPETTMPTVPPTTAHTEPSVGTEPVDGTENGGMTDGSTPADQGRSRGRMR